MSNEVEQVESDPEIDDEHNELIGEHELIECEPEIIIEDEQFDLIDQEYSGSKKTKKSAHEETKLFKCSFCDKNYGTKYSLKEHIGVVHEGKKYKCDECGEVFSWKSGLNSHIRETRHAQQTEVKIILESEVVNDRYSKWPSILTFLRLIFLFHIYLELFSHDFMKISTRVWITDYCSNQGKLNLGR